jgi:hypothetical protein
LPALLTAKISVTPALPSVADKTRGIPKSVDRIVAKMLHRDTEKRVASTEELLTALRPLEGRQLDKPQPRRAALLSAAATFVLVAGAGMLLSAVGEKPEAQASRAVDLDTLVQEAQAQEVEEAAEAEIKETAEMDEEIATDVAPERAHEIDPLESEVQEILSLYRKGSKIAAHHRMKKLAHQAPQSVAVARGTVMTARGVKAWGEAFDAAKLWYERTSAPEAGVAFARLEKATLRGNPIQTLEKVLAAHPDFLPAQDLLEKYRAKKVASR